jgi:hypothetical protein
MFQDSFRTFANIMEFTSNSLCGIQHSITVSQRGRIEPSWKWCAVCWRPNICQMSIGMKK